MTDLDDLRRRFWRRRAPEERALLGCMRLEPTQKHLERLAAACDGVAWDAVLHTAVRHQVAPLVFENLGRCGERVLAAMPEPVRDGFHHAMLRNLVAKRALAEARNRALDEFAELGIDVMLVKGTALDHGLYPEPWYTASADVDLLLRAHPGELVPAVRARITELNHARPAVDVHAWRHPDLVMNGVLAVDFDGIWQRAVPIEVDGRAAFRMSAGDELLAACINGCRKRYFRLKSLCETAALVRREPERDWAALTGRAVRWGCGGIAYTALVAAAIGAGCELPADLARQLRVGRARRAVLDLLLQRMSFGSLATIHRHRRLLGKYFSRWLLLRYASMAPGQLLRSARTVGRQMARR